MTTWFIAGSILCGGLAGGILSGSIVGDLGKDHARPWLIWAGWLAGVFAAMTVGALAGGLFGLVSSWMPAADAAGSRATWVLSGGVVGSAAGGVAGLVAGSARAARILGGRKRLS